MQGASPGLLAALVLANCLSKLALATALRVPGVAPLLGVLNAAALVPVFGLAVLVAWLGALFPAESFSLQGLPWLRMIGIASIDALAMVMHSVPSAQISGGCVLEWSECCLPAAPAKALLPCSAL
jgi:hypothetical protein